MSTFEWSLMPRRKFTIVLRVLVLLGAIAALTIFIIDSNQSDTEARIVPYLMVGCAILFNLIDLSALIGTRTLVGARALSLLTDLGFAVYFAVSGALNLAANDWEHSRLEDDMCAKGYYLGDDLTTKQLGACARLSQARQRSSILAGLCLGLAFLHFFLWVQMCMDLTRVRRTISAEEREKNIREDIERQRQVPELRHYS